MKRIIFAVFLISWFNCSPNYKSGSTKCSDDRMCPNGFSCYDDGKVTLYCRSNEELGCPDTSNFYCPDSDACFSTPGECSTVTYCGTAQNPGHVICMSPGYSPDCYGTKCSPGQLGGNGGGGSGGTGGTGGGGTCGIFSSCGGDLTGTWIVDSFCTEGSLTDALEAEAGLPSACDGIFKSANIDISGTLQYANSIETPNLVMTMKVLFQYTSACISALAGTSVVLSQAACDAGATSVQDSGFDTVTCTLASGSCNCNGSLTQTSMQSTPYSLSGGTIKYSAGNDAQYCVSGNILAMRIEDGMEGLPSQISAHR
jgi:hypothetical protein